MVVSVKEGREQLGSRMNVEALENGPTWLCTVCWLMHSRQTRGVPSRQPGLSNLASSYQGSEAGHGFAPKREPGSAAGSSHPPETNQYVAASAPSSDNTRLDAGLFGILGNSLDSGLDPLASHSALRAPPGFASAGAGESTPPSGASAGRNS